MTAFVPDFACLAGLSQIGKIFIHRGHLLNKPEHAMVCAIGALSRLFGDSLAGHPESATHMDPG
jgi:hypothetical protein